MAFGVCEMIFAAQPPHVKRRAKCGGYSFSINDLFEIANSRDVPNENDVQILTGLAYRRSTPLLSRKERALKAPLSHERPG